jgi:hypothetical protein
MLGSDLLKVAEHPSRSVVRIEVKTADDYQPKTGIDLDIGAQYAI